MTQEVYEDADYQHISALNDLLFCERRAALHLIEGIWRDNQYTVEGSYAHRNVDVEANLKRGDKRNVTGMWLVSHRLGLIGRADLVEFRHVAEPLRGSQDSQSTVNAKHSSSASRRDAATLTPYPVDFKRGKKRRWDNNEVQLCAQALCLEEMLHTEVPCGAIFHIRSQHRQEVPFDDRLREKTEQAARRLRQLVESQRTPTAKFMPKCKGCSLLEWCMPKSLRPRATAKKYLESLLTEDPTATETV